MPPANIPETPSFCSVALQLLPLTHSPPPWFWAGPVTCSEPGNFHICSLEVLSCRMKEPSNDAGETTRRERRQRLKEDEEREAPAGRLDGGWGGESLQQPHLQLLGEAQPLLHEQSPAHWLSPGGPAQGAMSKPGLSWRPGFQGSIPGCNRTLGHTAMIKESTRSCLAFLSLSLIIFAHTAWTQLTGIVPRIQWSQMFSNPYAKTSVSYLIFVLTTTCLIY